MKKELNCKFYEFKEGDEKVFNNTSEVLRKEYTLVYNEPTGIDKVLYFSKDKHKTLFNILEKEIYPKYPNSVFTACIVNSSVWTGKGYAEKPHLFIYVKEED